MGVNEMSENGRVYCPICGRTIVAVNIDDVENGDDDGYLFVHDDIVHTDSDLEALHAGVQ
jgi:hypothetical protein